MIWFERVKTELTKLQLPDDWDNVIQIHIEQKQDIYCEKILEYNFNLGIVKKRFENKQKKILKEDEDGVEKEKKQFLNVPIDHMIDEVKVY